jgi:uncharacterized protein (TIGR03382 family)
MTHAHRAALLLVCLLPFGQALAVPPLPPVTDTDVLDTDPGVDTDPAVDTAAWETGIVWDTGLAWDTAILPGDSADTSTFDTSDTGWPDTWGVVIDTADTWDTGLDTGGPPVDTDPAPDTDLPGGDTDTPADTDADTDVVADTDIGGTDTDVVQDTDDNVTGGDTDTGGPTGKATCGCDSTSQSAGFGLTGLALGLAALRRRRALL